jgi:two-component system OmpR family response regulator
MNTKRILAVDDKPSVTRNLKLNLESGGDYEVLGENQATNALAAARAFQPDLILLDVMMPDMDGGDVAARLHADPVLRDTPVIFLTGIVSNEETGGHEMVSGGETFLAKPVDTDVLIKCIEQTLSRKSQSGRRALSFAV